MKKTGTTKTTAQAAQKTTAKAAPKTAAKGAVKQPLRTAGMTKRQLSRHQRDQRQSTLVIMAGSASLAVVVLVVLAAVWFEVLRKGDEAIASVAGTPVTLTTYAKALGYRGFAIQTQYDQLVARYQELPAPPTPEASTSGDTPPTGDNPPAGDKPPPYDSAQLERSLIQQQLQRLQLELSNLEPSVLDGLTEGLLVRQEAARRGMTVSGAEVDKKIVEISPAMQTSLLPRVATGQPESPQVAITGTTGLTTTLSPSELAAQVPKSDPELLQEAKQSIVDSKFLTEDELRYWIAEPLALRAKLDEQLQAQIATSSAQVRARHILVETEETAKQVIDRLGKGEDFAALAQELSTDNGSKDKGGELGWFPRGAMVKEFEDAAFSLAPGTRVSEPVKSQYGFHIIELEESDPNRPLSEESLAQLKRAALSKWLTATKESPDKIVQSFLTLQKLDWVRVYVSKVSGVPVRKQAQ